MKYILLHRRGTKEPLVIPADNVAMVEEIAGGDSEIRFKEDIKIGLDRFQMSVLVRESAEDVWRQLNT